MRKTFPLIGSMTLLLAACADQSGDNPPAPVSGEPPAIEEIRQATIDGIDGKQITLSDGRWQGEPWVEGGSSAPSAGLVEGFSFTGDTDGDGSIETVVLLWSGSGGSGTFSHVAVMGREKDGGMVNRATVPLGERVQVITGQVAGQRIEFTVVQAGPGDAACCPGQKARRSFILEGEEMTEIPSEDLGRLSLADLQGEWILTRFSRDEELPPDIEITLQFENERIAGKAACNRYNGSVNEGAAPGEISAAGPMASTRMMCPPPLMEAEQRYLSALQNVQRFSFIAGTLVLTWNDGEEYGTLTFERSPN